MVDGSDVGREVRFVVDGVEGARGTLMGLVRDDDNIMKWWAQIRGATAQGGRRVEEFPAELVEVVP